MPAASHQAAVASPQPFRELGSPHLAAFAQYSYKGGSALPSPHLTAPAGKHQAVGPAAIVAAYQAAAVEEGLEVERLNLERNKIVMEREKLEAEVERLRRETEQLERQQQQLRSSQPQVMTDVN